MIKEPTEGKQREGERQGGRVEGATSDFFSFKIIFNPSTDNEVIITLNLSMLTDYGEKYIKLMSSYSAALWMPRWT